MKFKPGTLVELTVEEDFPICSRVSGVNIFQYLSFGYQFGIEAGKHVGTIKGSTHGSFQGYYSIKIQVSKRFYALLDVPQEKIRALTALEKRELEKTD